jgi:hypothetical protein
MSSNSAGTKYLLALLWHVPDCIEVEDQLCQDEGFPGGWFGRRQEIQDNQSDQL